ncbi:hypothetical protein E2C01_009704 [Portunus trituberculatus]|uniref:Uncharacterized protein n=1 Tax=Portunus trituberculatus TaxID=210409 RepID=A0A5B7D6Q7_PORTR|nr:hypothetical protein [Portunus trituberculatus]
MPIMPVQEPSGSLVPKVLSGDSTYLGLVQEGRQTNKTPEGKAFDQRKVTPPWVSRWQPFGPGWWVR